MGAWWRGYWLAPGGRAGAAAVRIAIAVAVLWTLHRLGSHGYAADPAAAPAALYRPIGIWWLVPGQPSVWVIELVRAVAWMATAAMLVGWWARASHAVSLVATLALASYDVAFAPTWSHHNSLPLLAHLAFLGARAGDAWSVDAWLRRRRGAPPRDVAGGYQWSLRLVQLAIALPFFAAACFKLYAAGGSLDWALSDNLRHQLLARFDRLGLPRTAAADWLLTEAWHWRAAAMLNLTAQALPIAAVGLVGRPGLRALCGAVWALEVLGLGIVMGLWNLHWLPLCAAFIDWDQLGHPRRAPAIAGPGGRAALAFVTAFVLVHATHALALNQRTRAYPFSAFPMFGEVRARMPYDRHQSYEMIGGRIELVTARPLTAAEQAWIDRHHAYRFMWQHRDPAELHRDLAGVLAETQARFADAGVRAVRLYLTVFVAPPYPAPPRLDPVDLARIAELDRDGQFRTALGALGADARTITDRARGLELAAARLLVVTDDRPAPVALAATRVGNAIQLAAPLAGDPVYVCAELGEVRWLVAWRAQRGY